MKKILSFVAAALVLASCQSDEFTANVNSGNSNEAISFSVSDVLATRGETTGAKAAALLNNNFIVYGYKLKDAEAIDGSSDQAVFDLYNVNYETASANLTQSNTADWEYVGYDPAAGGANSQSIKYWDYSAKGYVFSAISGIDVTVEKIKTVAGAEATVYDKGWKVTIPNGGSLKGLYASKRYPVANNWNKDTNPNFTFPNPVSLKFYSMASKVRFAMYETVPGYSVKINKFYYTDDTEKSSETNFVVDGTFKVLSGGATATVTYYSAKDASQGLGIENCPKVEWDDLGTTKKSAYMFGTNIQCDALGTASSDATYDQAGGEYTYILPYQSTTNVLSLKVDYTLTSTDGSGEEITVYGATATVPANYTQWKENFAYTYLFKISDKTNGSTIKEGPEGLYPITFDACVIAEEDGIQETVTSLGEPAITTYAEGEVATKNADYAAGDVYFSATQAKAPVDLTKANAKVYEVYNYGKGEITEALVEDYKVNKVVLVPVATTQATVVPLKDGSKLSFAEKMCYKFTADAGKTYAIQVKYNTDKYAYKIVKVKGTSTPTEPSYTLKATTNEIKDLGGEAVVKLACGTAGVVGAENQIQILKGLDDVTAKFTITEQETAGEYKLALKEELVNEGANGSYSVKFKDESDNITVSLAYEITYTSGNEAIVVTGGSTDFVTLKIGDTPIIGAKISDAPAGISVKDNADGTYVISADKTATVGAPALKIAGQGLNVTVISFSFDPDSKTIDWPEGKIPNDLDNPTIQLKKDGEKYEVNVPVVSSNHAVFGDTITSPQGALTIIPKAGGNTKLTYENAVFDYTVNQYELKGSVATFARATESTKLTFWCNGKQQSASTARVKVKKYNDGTYNYDIPVTTGFSLTTNGRDLVFGNVVVAAKYMIEYYNEAGDKRLGYEQIEVK